MAYEGRQAKMLSKLISGKGKNKSFLPGHSPQVLSPSNLVTPKRGVPANTISRRRVMLNKMFMQHITDLIASDPISDELTAYNLEICNVEVTKTYGMVNVYWSISRSTDYDLVQTKLTSIAGKLRSQLIRMQVMGIVPKIAFVQDKQASYMTQLEDLYERADYGEDYEPGQNKTTIKRKFDTEPFDQGEDPSLTMRNDVFGLNHSIIMGRVKQNLAKARKALEHIESKTPNELGPARTFTLSTSLGEIRDYALQRTRTREVILDFLRQKRLQYKELRALNQSRFIEPKMEEEEAFFYMEDVDSVDNNLCDDDDDAFIEEMFCSLTGNASYQFEDCSEKNIDKLKNHSHVHSKMEDRKNK